MKKLKTPILTTDGIVFEKGKILLVNRDILPYKGYWVLPGGHVNYGEKVEDACRREMKEELGINVKIKKLIGVYSNPKRDTRYHTVSVVLLCQRVKGKIHLNFEGSEFRFFSSNKLPRKIGFDHKKILSDFQKFVNIN